MESQRTATLTGILDGLGNRRQGPDSGAVSSGWKLPAALGLLAFCVAFVGMWIPSFWDDEIATISAARRSPGELLLLLQSVDAVHGLYYLFMHFWTSVFGFSEIAMRIPSALAVGLACAGTTIIGRRLGSPTTGIAAGLVLAFLPRMVWAGTEARQSAFAALLAVALTLLLLRAWESNRVLDWVLYGLCAVVGVWMFMFFVLAVMAHAAAAVILRRRVLGTLVASAVAGATVLPFVLHALGQKAQVDWIQNRSLAQTLMTAAVKQFFYGDDRPTNNAPPQWVLGAMLVLGVIEVGLVVWGIWASRRHGRHRTLIVLGLSIILLPALGLLLVSVLAQPVYVARYLTFTAPAFALLVGLGISQLPARKAWLRPVALAAVVLCSLVPQLTIKSVVSEPADTERRVAGMLDGALPRPAAVVFGEPYLRDLALAYPEHFDGVADLALEASPAESGTLWGVNSPVAAGELARRGNVLFVGQAGAPADLSAFAEAGCRETDNRPFERMVLISFTCS
ncbi:mannosyltransferase [Pseudarthrobacter equi]|uniref:Mannosyltransferase n=1 Tax=Pseudarthrobacter equi TaxID=728066 RepID=A0A1H2B5S4_9MICC|nr:glycosyltransferase family 39 protein [Pseudarthrobacter equi]SDT53534.1 mannosyltransferase [Pseudarthrobacter equi]